MKSKVQNLDNKELQRKRMITYFVEATCKIIDTDGVEAVTVRKVANLAGYNSATLYNYFDNLNHSIAQVPQRTELEPALQ